MINTSSPAWLLKISFQEFKNRIFAASPLDNNSCAEPSQWKCWLVAAVRIEWEVRGQCSSEPPVYVMVTSHPQERPWTPQLSPAVKLAPTITHQSVNKCKRVIALEPFSFQYLLFCSFVQMNFWVNMIFLRTTGPEWQQGSKSYSRQTEINKLCTAAALL